MKKLLMLLTLCSTLTITFGQGQVNFYNFSGFDTLVSTNALFGPPGLMSGSGGEYDFALFWAPAGTTDPSLFQFSGAYATNISLAGRFSNGGFGANYAPAIPGQPALTTVNVLFRGWSHDPLTFGTPVQGDPTVWENVQYYVSLGYTPYHLDWYGESAIGTVLLGGGDRPAQPIPNPFGIGPGQINTGFTLNPIIPEPSTGALMALGATGMLLFRRWRR